MSFVEDLAFVLCYAPQTKKNGIPSYIVVEEYGAYKGEYLVAPECARLDVLEGEVSEEHLAAAEVIKNIIEHKKKVGLLPWESAANIIHKEWLKRHPEEKGGEKDLSYFALPELDQSLILGQYILGNYMNEASFRDYKFNSMNEAVKTLEEARNLGANIKINFNGKTLYSAFDNEKTCQLKINKTEVQ